MKYGFSDYNLSVEDAIRELDNFANYGIDMGEKDHDKFFVDRWLRVRDIDLSEVDELKAEIEDLEDQLEDAIDEDDYADLEEKCDILKEMFKVLKKNYRVTTTKGTPIDWKAFEAFYGYEE